MFLRFEVIIPVTVVSFILGFSFTPTKSLFIVECYEFTVGHFFAFVETDIFRSFYI